MPAETPQDTNSSPFLSAAPAVDVLTRLGQGLGARKPLLVLTGESGMGKSPLAREALRRCGERATVAWMVEPHLEAKDVATTLLGLFGGTVKPGTSPLAMSERLLETLANVTAGGRVALLVVDDAHLVGDDVLVELQRIADRSAGRQCPLEILLVGQPPLAARLTEPGLAAVNEQVSHRFELAPLNAHMTRRHLLLLPAPPDAPRPPQFSRKACRDIHTASHGIPRNIEAIAAESTRLAAKANSTTVSPEHVREAVRSVKLEPAPRPSSAPARSMPAAMAAASAEAASRVPPAPPAAEDIEEAKPSRAVPPAKAEPAKVEAKKAEPAKAETKKSEPETAPAHAVTNGTDATPSGEFTPSNDPRVKDWVARFGGSGVRLGGFFTGPIPDEPVAEVEEVEAVVEEAEPVVERVSRGVSRIESAVRAERPKRAERQERAESPEREARPERAARPEREARPARAATREMVGAAVSLDATDEPVNWPPRAMPTPAKSGPILGKRSSTSLGWPAVALLLAIALGGVMLAQRRILMSGSETATNPIDLMPQAEPQEPAPAMPAPVPAAPSRGTDNVRSKATPKEPGDTVTKPNRRARGTTASVAIRTERDEPVRPKRRAATDAPPTGTRYTVIVGSFLKPDMAWAEREHLSRLTNYPVWVSRRQIDGVRTYRIILGAFESTEIAETTAQNLLQRGLLRDAKVVALPLSP